MNNTRGHIARTLFQFHEHIWNDPELSQSWANLPDYREIGGLTKICKEEYLNMADGVIKKVLSAENQ